MGLTYLTVAGSCPSPSRWWYDAVWRHGSSAVEFQPKDNTAKLLTIANDAINYGQILTHHCLETLDEFALADGANWDIE